MKNVKKKFTKGTFHILFILFYTSQLSAQTVNIDNKSNYALSIKAENKKFILKENEKKEFSKLKTFSLSNQTGFQQQIYLFLEPKETLSIKITDKNVITYKGSKDSLQSYIGNLNIITFGELKNYYRYYYQEKNSKKYINSSEILFANISKKVNKLNTPSNSEETTKSLNNYIKYNWLYTVFLGFTTKNTDGFQKEIAPYYYKKYIKDDIPNFQCENSYQYDVLKYLVKYKKQLSISLPTYEVVAKDENDYINQYLPKSCQRYYFEINYKYLNHINNPDKEYYKKILINQFHIDTLE